MFFSRLRGSQHPEVDHCGSHPGAPDHQVRGIDLRSSTEITREEIRILGFEVTPYSVISD